MCISHRGEEKGYRFFSPDVSSAEAAWRGGKENPRHSLYLQMGWQGSIAKKVCYGDTASLMGEVTFTQQQQHLSWSLSFVHASSYPEGHDKRVSRSISKPPMSVRGEVKLTRLQHGV